MDRARELACYQDQPLQQPAGAPGKTAYLRMGFERRGDRTELVDLERRTPLLVQQALHFDEGMPSLACVYIICTSGGVLQGDRTVIEIHVAQGAQAYVSTQSATKLHEMDANYALQMQALVLEDGAYLEYLPEVTIPYKNSRFFSRSKLTVAPTATLLYAESVMPGRKYYERSELFAYDVFSTLVRGERPDGRELFTEKLLIEPGRRNVRQTGVMGRFDVFANVLLLTPKGNAEAIFEQTQPEVDLDPERGLIAAASRLPNEAGLIFKIAGVESETVRDKVREVWSRVRRHVTGCEVPAPFAWR
jgi:urease accessory protein